MLLQKVGIIFFTWMTLITGLATQDQDPKTDHVFELKEPLIGPPENTVQENTNINVSLTYCCPGGNLYKPFFDRCPFWDPNDNSTELQLDNIPIYSTHNDQIVQSSPQIEITDSGFTDCPNGYFGNSTRDFKLFDDGSLRIGEKRLEPKSFCINQIHSSDENSLILVARFCDADPCSVNGVKCIRKCCPQGMAINAESKICESNSLTFSTSELRDENNNPINLKSFTLFGGLGIKCLSLGVGINKVDPADFVILPDGRMKNLDYPCKPLEFDERTTDNYCVDNIFSDNETEFFAARCFPSAVDNTDPEGLAVFPYLSLFTSVFIIATLLIYSILPKLRNSFGVVVMCYLASMTVSYLGLATIQLYRDMPNGICVTLPVIVHYGYLATFSWLNVVCYDLWRVFGIEKRSNRSQQNDNRLDRSFIFYSVYGWGLPLIIVSIGQILQYVERSSLKCDAVTPDFGNQTCWFYYRSSIIAYLHGPIGVMILGNIIMFMWASIKFYRSSLETRRATGNKRGFQRFRVILSLFFLMGVSWTTEVISFLTQGTFKQWIATDSINILTGFFVFIIFVCKPKVWQMLKEKFKCFDGLSSVCRRCFTTFTLKNKNWRVSSASSGNVSQSTSHTQFSSNNPSQKVTSNNEENTV